MSEWENKMTQVRKAFDLKVFHLAISENYQALALAKRDYADNLDENNDSEKSVASVMVSYFSLADSYIEIKDFDSACWMYQQSLNFIRELYKDSLQKSGLETVIHHAANKLKLEWNQFQRNHQDESMEKGELFLGFDMQKKVGSQMH